MRKIAIILPLPIILALYACAAGTDGELDDPPVLSSKDASDDAATTVRKDSGPASPPKEAGASSSGDAGRDAGHSSSGGSSSSSSSSGGGGVTECDSNSKVAFGALILAADPDLPPGFTKVGSCSACTNMSSAGCCAEFTVFPQGTYCIDPGTP